MKNLIAAAIAAFALLVPTAAIAWPHPNVGPGHHAKCRLAALRYIRDYADHQQNLQAVKPTPDEAAWKSLADYARQQSQAC